MEHHIVIDSTIEEELSDECTDKEENSMPGTMDANNSPKYMHHANVILFVNFNYYIRQLDSYYMSVIDGAEERGNALPKFDFFKNFKD